ncbi:MAG: hypothetical protein HYS34_04140 [Acidobacteria bacterium]|nr:hypothetical protein [Acidobacteriota bacterium]
MARGEAATVKRMRDEARALGRWRFLDERPPARHVVRPRPVPLDDGEWHASLRRDPGTARGRMIRLGMGAVLMADVSAAARCAAGCEGPGRRPGLAPAPGLL